MSTTEKQNEVKNPEEHRKSRICFFTSNRADFSKIKPVISILKRDYENEVVVQIVVVGSHLLADCGYTINEVKRDFEVDCQMYTLITGSDNTVMAESVGLMMTKLPGFMNILKPDIIVIHGDRFDVVGIALTAALMNIKIAHIEGGECSGTIDDVIRHTITKASHFHLVCNEKALQRTKFMGEDEKNIFLTGCPSYTDIFKFVDNESEESIQRSLQTVGFELTDKFCIVSFHPVTTDIENSLRHFCLLLDAVVQSDINMRVILLYPNVDAGNKRMTSEVRKRKLEKRPHVTCMKNIHHLHYISLMKRCSLFIGNSSAGIREIGIFGNPAINVGKRQDGRDTGKNVIHVSDPQSVEDILTPMNKLFDKKFEPVFLYGSADSAYKAAKVLAEKSQEREFYAKKIPFPM